jgi:hypothetical protein
MNNKVRVLVLEEYFINDYIYFPNFCTKYQLSVGKDTRAALERLVEDGILTKVKAPRYNGQVLSEYAVPENQEFPDDMEDFDFEPIAKGDYEVSHFYKRVK